MDSLYEWLYDTYAEPKLAQQPLFQNKLLAPLLDPLSEEERLACLDLLNTLRLHWCTAAFTLGVHTGIELRSY